MPAVPSGNDFINCPNCGTRNFRDDIVCGVCKRSLKTEVKQDPIDKPKGKKNSGCVIILCIALIVVIYGQLFKRESPSSPDQVATLNQTQSSTGNFPVSQLPKYEIVNVGANNRRLLEVTVRLTSKIPENQLSTMARIIKAEMNAESPMTSIFFLLPGMKVGEGAWAKATFNPYVSIQFYTSTKESEDNLKNVPRPSDLIGLWEYTNDVLLAIKKTTGSEYEFLYVSPKDLNAPQPLGPIKLRKIKRNGKTVYAEYEEGSKFSYEIKPNGDLYIYDGATIESVHKRLK